MNNKINPIHQPLPLNPKPVTKNEAPTKSFKSFLEQASQDIKVSKHAQQRLNERSIQIDEQKWQQITSKMNEAKQKGVTDSVIVLRDAVLVASTKNNTIITAMDRNEAEDQLVTNVNGTIILQD
ncbi:TIGR02530 family flagellar biosynthesis protein [Tenuibacillus multivorans]|uniref:Flagellar operon protein n=1 Tax=Tenuibacillus multivorans TaxID=237069 RepID=A0A1G9XZI7_9BACI|nr:TIGR02530 family flagellar biosynthesis protein [Tenuibacillus multivorans]GEL75873.1 flagellar protein [Tenuibacillus multivorans]SDN01866.1 flagellar operon protein [Tenuibacillus multivorans]